MEDIMTTDITVLESLMAIHLDVNIWTARKKLSPADFGGAELPPEDLASLGSKRVCDPEDLKVFGTLKARAVSLLDRHGIRFLGGWAIPHDRAEEIGAELATIRDAFMEAKETFLARYDEAVQEWITRHTGWEQIIASSTVGADYVRSRMGFRWQVYRIMPPALPHSVEEGLCEEVVGLGSRLFGEVAKAATEAWHKCYAGKTEITRKALSPLRTIHQKLSGLTFVEPRVAPIADLLQVAFESLPKRGKIEGASLFMLQGVVALLRDTGALVEHGQKILEGASPQGLLAILGGPAAASDSVADDLAVEIDDVVDDLAPAPVFPGNPQPTLPSYGLW